MAGRPSKYTPEMLELAEQYLDYGYLEGGNVIPSTVGLSLYLNVTRSTLDRWSKEGGKEAFWDILDQIQAKQHQLLINSGLAGDFNSAITKLVLGKHGYHERQEVSGPDGADIGISAPWAVTPVKAAKGGK